MERDGLRADGGGDHGATQGWTGRPATGWQALGNAALYEGQALGTARLAADTAAVFERFARDSVIYDHKSWWDKHKHEVLVGAGLVLGLATMLVAPLATPWLTGALLAADAARAGWDAYEYFKDGDIAGGTAATVAAVLLVALPVAGGLRWVRLTRAQAEAMPETVWARITPTQEVYPGTHVPRSFTVDCGDGTKVWVNGNATKHIAQYMEHVRYSHGWPMTEQEMLASLVSAIQTASKQGIVYEDVYLVDGWQLVFDAPRSPDLLPVLKHALRPRS